MYSSMDMQQAQDAADMLTAARDQKLLPKPIELTVDMLWLIVFFRFDSIHVDVVAGAVDKSESKSS